MTNPHREICSLCHEISRIGFWVPDEIWAAIIHISKQQSIVCLRCFSRLGDEKGVEWDKNIKLFPISWITFQKTIKAKKK